MMWPLGWRSITYFIRGLSYLSFLISLLLLTIEVSGLETRDGSINSPAIHTRNITGSGCVEDCSCHGEGRCKPCSRFEMGRQVHGCLRTGYRQWAYCSQEKISKYVSCHYQVDSGKHRAFWLFQMMMLLLGSVSLAVVYWRQKRIEGMMAHRINQQIRA